MGTLIKRQFGEFQGFGDSILAKVARQALQQQEIPSERLEGRAMLRENCPLTSGVYGWLDQNNRLCYVGKSKSLRKRLLSYFAKTPSDPKMGRIKNHSRRIVWEPVANELMALIREQELIYRWRPDFNSQGQPTRRQPAFVGLSGGAASRVVFTSRVTTGHEMLVGPIPGRGQLREAVECLNQVFQLRDCSDKTQFHFDDQGQLFGPTISAQCIRYELGSCPGPCAGLCSRGHYQNNIDAARRFLELKDLGVLDRLNAQMENAARQQRYQRAAALRDQLETLSWLVVRLTTLIDAREQLNGVLPMNGFNGRRIWLLLRKGRLAGSLAEPKSQRRGQQALKKIELIAAQTDSLAANLMEMNFQLMIMAACRKDAQLLKRLMTFEQAAKRCARWGQKN